MRNDSDRTVPLSQTNDSRRDAYLIVEEVNCVTVQFKWQRLQEWDVVSHDLETWKIFVSEWKKPFSYYNYHTHKHMHTHINTSQNNSGYNYLFIREVKLVYDDGIDVIVREQIIWRRKYTVDDISYLLMLYQYICNTHRAETRIESIV